MVNHDGQEGTAAMALSVHQFGNLSDNYGALGWGAGSQETFCVDAADAAAILTELEQTGRRLTHALITHHHDDHVAGLAELKAKSGCIAIGPAGIAGIDRVVRDGERFALCGEEAVAIATPGHTLDMTNYHFPASGIVFTGDTLFAMGCGRIFEGTAAQMWGSLRKLIALPADTRIHCGHEYTLANGRFALSVDPDNAELRRRVAEVEALRAAGRPTIPTLLSLELATNPFLRAGDPAIRRHLGMENATDAEVFGEIRRRKDRFR
jgi:hydroxyacylglutathione hydrolase